MRGFYDFWRRRDGQDIVEYSLIVAFVAITGVALLMSWGAPVQGMWSKGSATVASANTNLTGS
jgi:Flp pilus assembly pilin Flp